MSTFTMLIGVPGSGKSTYAIHHLNDITIWLSSDNLRESMYGDMTDQTHNSEIFARMNRLAVAAIYSGNDVIYDATNINAKRRKELLEKLPECHKKCVVMLIPREECIRRDARRKYSVGEKVIDRMIEQFQEPNYEEGWNEIDEIRFDDYK